MKKLLLALILVICSSRIANAQITPTFTFSPNTTILSAQVNSNFALLANALNRTGGTMTGTLTVQAIALAAHNTYDIGTTSVRVKDAYMQGVVYAIGGVNVNGTTAINSSGALASSIVAGVQIGSLTIVTVGKQTIWVPAAAMYPTITNGAVGPTTAELTAGNPNITTLSFTNGSAKYAQFAIAFPKSWDGSTITFQAYWTGTSAGAGTTIWGLQCVGSADNATIDAAFGTAIEVTDTFLSTKANHVAAESSAVTISGAAADTLTTCQVYRKGASDTRAAASLLLGVKVFFATNAKNDA